MPESAVTPAIRHSAIYHGTVRHRRRAPRTHAFAQRLHLAYLDLAELDAVLATSPLLGRGRFQVAGFHRPDYLGPADLPLDEAVRRRVQQEAGFRPAGPVRMLTHLRSFGYVFNPVSFYWCFDDDERVAAIVAEITNTPWKERHAYVLDAREQRGRSTQRWRFAKRFHVSPFFSMDLEHDWCFRPPGERIAMHMANRAASGRAFDATLALQRRPFTRRNLHAALLRRPFMPQRVHAAIYWQALRLWWKRVPFHPHPAKRNAPTLRHEP